LPFSDQMKMSSKKNFSRHALRVVSNTAWGQRLLWLNDRQSVKVLKSLNDRQSDIFLKFKESKEPIQFKLPYVD